MGVQIREFEERDSGARTQIIADCLLEVNIKDYPRAFIESLLPYYERHQDLAQEGIMTFVAETFASQLVGTGSVQPDGRVSHVYVDPVQHRKGVGQALMAHIEAWGRQQGATKLYLSASLTAVGFYQKLGYREQKRFTSQAEGVEVLMEKEI